MTIPVLYTEAADQRIKLIDSVGQEFYLPKTFEVRSEPIAKKSALLDVAYVHGAKDVSDGMFAQRTIEISGRIWAFSDAEYNSKWDALAEHLIKEDFRIQNRDRQVRIRKIEDISHEYPSTVGYDYGVVTIRMLAADPFWYGKTAQQKQIVITSSPKEFQWDIGGKVEVFPTIIFANAADNPDFKLENTTDAARELRVQDSLNLNGTTVTVDCANGTVYRGTTDIISKFSGLFLRLLGGRSNLFKYTGANCTITMQYYEAWI
jgi:phage-related protein